MPDRRPAGNIPLLIRLTPQAYADLERLVALMPPGTDRAAAAGGVLACWLPHALRVAALPPLPSLTDPAACAAAERTARRTTRAA